MVANAGKQGSTFDTGEAIRSKAWIVLLRSIVKIRILGLPKPHISENGSVEPPDDPRPPLDIPRAGDYDSDFFPPRPRPVDVPRSRGSKALLKGPMTMSDADPRSTLREFRKANDYFIGIDSDGCAFDTMEVKHKECFIPNIIQHFGLASVSRAARDVAEFVNLYSNYRGINRFPGLTLMLDLLAERPEVARRGAKLPPLDGLREWLARETRLGNPTLKAEAERTGDPDLARALAWSLAVNRSIGEVVKDVPPFPLVRESLEAMLGQADVMVVSATPGEALEREWLEHDLRKHVALIAGQESGSKKEVLAHACEQGYAKDHILMIGDAPGDLAAARANGVLFFPIEPGFEDESWQRFIDEGLPRFHDGTFAGPYMADRVGRFLALLPEVPPWKRS